jgi:uncharacterized protein YeaO (DUF488 family)
MTEIFVKRIYEQPNETDGLHILVDRLWPRGVKKDEGRIDYWFKELAPSAELRKWFGHIPERFEEFRMKYLIELNQDENKSKRVDELAQIALGRKVTLLYSAKDVTHNNAVVLEEELSRRISLMDNE